MIYLVGAGSLMLTDAMIPVNQGTSSMLAAKTKVNNSKLAEKNLQREGFLKSEVTTTTAPPFNTWLSTLLLSIR